MIKNYVTAALMGLLCISAVAQLPEVRIETQVTGASGNHLGSWVARMNFNYEDWGISVYADHYYEDHPGSGGWPQCPLFCTCEVILV